MTNDYQNNMMTVTGKSELVATAPLTTGTIQYYPATQPWNGYPSTQYIYTTVPATHCSGDVHVFPCAKCGDCKCGKAKLAR